MNRDDFTKRHYGRSAYDGKLAVAAAALVDAYVLAGSANKANFLTRLLALAKEYAGGVNGWDGADAEAMAKAVAGSLRLPQPPFAINWPDTTPALNVLNAGLASGQITKEEHRMLSAVCDQDTTVGQFRAAMRFAEKLRGEVK